jgi:hypothetical protein
MKYEVYAQYGNGHKEIYSFNNKASALSMIGALIHDCVDFTTNFEI